jgi:hypothetical protein
VPVLYFFFQRLEWNVGLFFKFPANSPSFPVGRNIVLRSGVFYRVFFFLFHVDIFPRHVFISSALSRASERMCWKTFEELEKEKVRQDKNGRETHKRESQHSASTVLICTQRSGSFRQSSVSPRRRELGKDYASNPDKGNQDRKENGHILSISSWPIVSNEANNMWSR